MAIVFHCSCGRLLRSAPEAAGKRTKCPGCFQILTIPAHSEAKHAVGVLTPTGPALNEEAIDLDWAEFEKPHIGSSDYTRISSGTIKVDDTNKRATFGRLRDALVVRGVEFEEDGFVRMTMVRPGGPLPPLPERP